MDVVAVRSVALDDTVVSVAHALAQVGELTLEGPQLAQALVDLAQSLVDQPGHVLAGSLVALSEGQRLLDLAEAEAEALGALDEADAVLVGGRVEPVSPCAALRGRDDTYDLLIGALLSVGRGGADDDPERPDARSGGPPTETSAAQPTTA